MRTKVPALGWLGLVGAFGCGKLADLDAYGAGPADDGVAPTAIQYSLEECGQCARSSCLTEQEACENEPECAELARCVFACEPDDGQCIGECGQRATAKPAAFGALKGCLEKNCARPCPSCVQEHALGSGPECAICAASDRGDGSNCALVAQCLDDLDCNAYRACLSTECRAFAPDPGCRLLCGGRHPEGARLMYLSSGDRIVSVCPSECRAGGRWECLPTTWPNTTAGTARVTLRALLFATPEPMHVTIASAGACRVGDPLCAEKVATGGSDPSGAVTLELPRSSKPDFGYYFEIELPNLRPIVFAPWQPLVGDITFWVPVFSFLHVEGGPLANVARQRGTPLDPELGIIHVFVADCIGAGGGASPPKLTVSATPRGPTDAIYGVIPDVTVESGGLAYFVNLPRDVNTTTIEVRLEGVLNPIARALVPVRESATTVVTFNYLQWP